MPFNHVIQPLFFSTFLHVAIQGGGSAFKYPVTMPVVGLIYIFCPKRNYRILLRDGPGWSHGAIFSKTNYRAYYIHYLGGPMVNNFFEISYRANYNGTVMP